MRPTTIPPSVPTPNGDEAAPFLGNFHKTLPHDADGVVEPAAYALLMKAAGDRRPGPASASFEDIPRGTVPQGGVAAALSNPQAGRARDSLGVDPFDIELWPAPKFASDSTAAEMTELFWLALCRDVPLDALHGGEGAAGRMADDAVAELAAAFARALDSDRAGQDMDAGLHLRPGLGLGLDLPCDADGRLALDRSTLFRGGLPDERQGPLVSQFLLQDVPFGSHTLRQLQRPYAPRRDYLQCIEDWLRAQDLGRDRHGRDATEANAFDDDPSAHEATPRRIGTMRDLARLVHRGTPQQPCINAALLLLDWKAPADPGNPYRRRLARQAPGATLGAPDLLALLGEVAQRAQKVVWRQKWMVHRRLRPEAHAGLMTMQAVRGRGFGLPEWAMATQAATAVRALNREANHGTRHAREDNLLLPMAYSAGAPAHPSYGAGNAVVAGACVTVLKAWFEEGQPIRPMIEAAHHPDTRQRLHVARAHRTEGTAEPYAGADLDAMTVGGELNKLASNIAFGRSAAGVQWRSDATRSLRLGEIVATVILARATRSYAEANVMLGYRSFDGRAVTITPDGIFVPGDPALEGYYRDLLQEPLPVRHCA
ncbi:hypothetical protein [Roseomonas sp. AR75]|uniref:hypothetical protein n=1 Tax=Roseomonas sp. AR75 TaxID=2562311 RepID=UPI0010C08E06|nr:hypothetical protein [Roseomonas sp. AR75]